MLIILAFLMLAQTVGAAVGCKDRCGHNVQCNAPCKKHVIMDDKGTCAECGHQGDINRGEMETAATAKTDNQMYQQLQKLKNQ